MSITTRSATELSETHYMAFAWASKGCRVFPVNPKSKKPTAEGWQLNAVGPGEMVSIFGMFKARHAVGIFTGGSGLLVLDFDVDPDRWVMTQMLPKTYVQTTRRAGGQHWYYWVPEGRTPGPNTSRFMSGLDVRAGGSYVIARHLPPEDWREQVAVAPDWLLRMCEADGRHFKGINHSSMPPERMKTLDEIMDQARLYLKNVPKFQPPGVNPKTYQLICQLRDIGLDELSAFDLLTTEWSQFEELGWSNQVELLKDTVRKAYLYAKGAQGGENPAPEFEIVPKTAKPGNGQKIPEGYDADHPLVRINHRHAWVLCGGDGRILYEKNNHDIQLIREEAWHKTHQSNKVTQGDKVLQVTKWWMGWEHRRTYTDLVFKPGGINDPFEYNLWRGFAVEPADADTPLDGFDGVKMWLELIYEIVANGDEEAAEWLLGFFAHLVQKPWEKPLVGVVLRSAGKGTGKNSCVELGPGHILGSDHCITTGDQRYLEGNFNAHLEKCLLLVLDEAFWKRGAKHAQAMLQNLITSKTHVIERKRIDPIVLPNLTRVFMLSNHDWVVPASPDERRYAVYDVSERRKQQVEWFEKMRVLLQEKNGNRWLMRYLLERPCSNIRVAPQTEALKDQVQESLDLIDAWWLDSMEEGRLLESGIDGWPEKIEVEQVCFAIYSYYSIRGWPGVKPSRTKIGRGLQKICPEMVRAKLKGTLGKYVWHYKLPTLKRSRLIWEAYAKGWSWKVPIEEAEKEG